MGLMDGLSTALATGLYLSYIPVTLAESGLGGLLRGRRGQWTGAGFIGTAEGLILVPFLPQGPVPFGLWLFFSTLLAVWLCGRAEKVLGRRDDQRIVLDEVVGFWTAVAFLPRTLRVLGLGFALFRVLDVLKPYPCRRLERLPGGWGVVGDDVGAGIFANLLIRVLMSNWPWLNS